MRASELRKIVSEIINKIENTRFRCHEIARILAEKLVDLKLDAKAIDGLVLYDINRLRSDFLTGFGITPKKTGGKVLAVHSWCEVNTNNKIIVVDWHSALHLSEYEIFESYLSVDEKNKLPHKYQNIGEKIGKFIIFPTPKLLPNIVRLRL